MKNYLETLILFVIGTSLARTCWHFGGVAFFEISVNSGFGWAISFMIGLVTAVFPKTI